MMTLDTVRAALALEVFDAAAAHERMSPGSRPKNAKQTEHSRQAGVLLLLFPEGHEWHIVLTRRTDHLRGHSGQISFPGGRRDPDDHSFTETALRETCEELGVCSPEIEIIGALSSIYIPPSDYEVFPSVGALPARPFLQPNPIEVAEVFTFTLNALLDDCSKAGEYREFQGRQVYIPFYTVHGHKVWGATAIMLSEFEQRLRQVL